MLPAIVRTGEREIGAGGANISDLVIQTKGDESQSSVRLYCLGKPGRFAVANVGVGSNAGCSCVDATVSSLLALALAFARFSSDERRRSRGEGGFVVY